MIGDGFLLRFCLLMVLVCCFAAMIVEFEFTNFEHPAIAALAVLFIAVRADGTRQSDLVTLLAVVCDGGGCAFPGRARDEAVGRLASRAASFCFRPWRRSTAIANLTFTSPFIVEESFGSEVRRPAKQQLFMFITLRFLFWLIVVFGFLIVMEVYL